MSEGRNRVINLPTVDVSLFDLANETSISGADTTISLISAICLSILQINMLIVGYEVGIALAYCEEWSAFPAFDLRAASDALALQPDCLVTSRSHEDPAL